MIPEFGRRDGNEKPIRGALKAAGARSWPLSGAGLPDLLILAPDGRWLVCEIKREPRKGWPEPKKTPAQVKMAGPWPTVRSISEALDLLAGGSEPVKPLKDPQPDTPGRSAKAARSLSGRLSRSSSHSATIRPVENS